MKFALKKWIGFAMTLAIVMLATNGEVSARDRPATPNQVDVVDCGAFNAAAVLCGAFEITLEDMPPFDVEKVKIESRITEDGRSFPSDPSHFGCASIRHLNRVPSYLDTHPQPPNSEPFQCATYTVGTGNAEFLMLGLKFDTNYCISLRARRKSDDVVSAKWSAPVCARTRAKPGIPSKPDIIVHFESSNVTNIGKTLDSVWVEYPPLKSDEGENSNYHVR